VIWRKLTALRHTEKKKAARSERLFSFP